MIDQKKAYNFQRDRNLVMVAYYSVALICGLIVGICSEMLAGFAFDQSHQILWIVSSIYITTAPALILLGIFYLVKQMLSNLGLLFCIEKSIYKAVGRFEAFKEFIGARENNFLLKNFSDKCSHFVKWTLRSILFVIGIITCVPFFAASAMTVATMPAPAIIAYNMLIIGTIIPLLFTTLLCEMIIYSARRLKRTLRRVEVINPNPRR